MKYLLLIVALALTPACAKAPPNLSPAGQIDYTAVRVVSGLDALMDVAIKLEAQTPKLVSTPTARRVVQYHQVAVKIVAARSSGWQIALINGLNQLLVTFNPSEQPVLAPYIDLIKVLMEAL